MDDTWPMLDLLALKIVRFDPIVKVTTIPKIMLKQDSLRFKRRILGLERLLEPFLLKHIASNSNDDRALQSDGDDEFTVELVESDQEEQTSDSDDSLDDCGDDLIVEFVDGDKKTNIDSDSSGHDFTVEFTDSDGKTTTKCNENDNNMLLK